MDDAMMGELRSRQQITDVIRRRARAADRFDVDLARTCCHDGATEGGTGLPGRSRSPREVPAGRCWDRMGRVRSDDDEELM